MRWLLVVLSMGCVSQPPFTVQTCLDACNQCPGIDCPPVCDQLNTGIESPICHDASQEVWTCASRNGCSFLEVCTEEVETFLQCNP